MSLQRSFENTFIETVKLRNLLPCGSDIFAAVSGGSDSVALLQLLHRFANHMHWKLAVLHIDHRARPRSGEDAVFVKDLAEGIGLRCNVEEISSHGSGSSEGHFSAERTRIYREYASEKILITTGHTASDRAETLLMRLLEGSGLRGLGGMDYFGRGSVRRPLLDFTRRELREYLEEIGQNWIEDPTNQEDSFLRNRIRHRVIPVLESISPGSTCAIARSSANLSQWRDIADSIIDDSLDELLEGDTFRREMYLILPRAVRLGILWAVSGRPRGGKRELEKTDRWILGKKDGYHILPGGARITAEGGRIHILQPLKSAGKVED
ncbi:MAG: tRNA lysidine(34) synthetase TilS [Candidatus Aegiribacteria sp.]|nr:tRNA lysidine(34) synthetase TilS [Candidatus Aegiribacteria sp.]